MEKVILNHKREIIPFPELYEKYSMDIYRYSLSILKDEDDAKDAVQETFVKYEEKKDEKLSAGGLSEGKYQFSKRNGNGKQN